MTIFFATGVSPASLIVSTESRALKIMHARGALAFPQAAAASHLGSCMVRITSLDQR